MAKIAFIQNIWMEYPGVMYLSAFLKKNGHEAEVFIDNNENRLAKKVGAYSPGIAGFSCTTGLHEDALRIAGFLKTKMSLLNVFGGPHPTFFPEIIEERCVDVVCRGEGERALLDLANAVDKKQDITAIPNLWVRRGNDVIKNDVRPFIEDLDSLPFQDRGVYYGKYSFMNRPQKVFIAGRGCPYKCSYCFNESMQVLYEGKGKYIRLRSVENVIEEIKETKKRYGLETVYMGDDTFILNKAWLFEFLERYKREIGLPFICLVRVDLISEEMVKRLKDAGCYSVFFGVESGDENLRKLILNKNITDDQIIHAAAFFKKYGIKFRTYNMLGIPGENMESALKTVDLNIRIKTDYPWASILQPYPKTAIRENAVKNGMLQAEEGQRFSKYFFKKSILNSVDAKRLSNLQKLFYWTVKFPFLKPFVKKLVNLPPNPLFDVLFLIGYGYSYYKSERLRLIEVWRIGQRNVASFLFS